MKRKLLLIMIGTLLCLLLVAFAVAQSNSFSINWWTVDGGGGTSTGNDYSLSGTIGQADAHLEISGSGFSLAGGYWVQGSGGEIYLPLIIAP